MRMELAYFNANDSSAKQEILIKKVNYYLSNQLTSEATLNEIKRVKTKWIKNDTLKYNFLWNASLIAYLNRDESYAKFYLNAYENLSNDTSIQCKLLSVLVNKYQDTSITQLRIQQLSATDSLFGCLSCFKQVALYQKKHLNFYLISSAILPGSGSIMNGNVLKGAVSLALAATSVYSIVYMVNQALYLNAALWGTGLGLKFYTGNIKLTESLFNKSEMSKKNKLATKCELQLEKILNKYPIALKAL